MREWHWNSLTIPFQIDTVPAYELFDFLQFVQDSVVWEVSRDTFRAIVAEESSHRQSMMVKFLKDVPVFGE